MKAIDLPPFAPILIESTRAIGYSLEAAIADIIDNSIAADASNVHVRFFPVDEPYLAIIDAAWMMRRSPRQCSTGVPILLRKEAERIWEDLALG